jgi:putative redox protein
MGSCSAIDVVSMLTATTSAVAGCEVLLSGERVECAPRRFASIHLHFVVSGAVTSAAVAEAVQQSMATYCSIALMLEKMVKITHSYQIVNA